jgi:Ca2+-binding RTX toxin-like protein
MIPLPAVGPMFRTAYTMKIGAGASDHGDWAYTGSVYPTSLINPYTAARGLAETTAQDALHIEGGHFADVLMSDWAGSELKGLGGDDWLLGDLGNDTLMGAADNDTLAGGAGFDTAVYSGLRSDYIVTRSGNELTVTDKRDTADNDGIDRLSGIEQLRFVDGDVPVSSSAPSSGKAYFWNNTPGRGHALLSGVNLLQVGDDTPSDSPVYLKNGAWDASGRASRSPALKSTCACQRFWVRLRCRWSRRRRAIPPCIFMTPPARTCAWPALA